jgi:hypothetical protein
MRATFPDTAWGRSAVAGLVVFTFSLIPVAGGHGVGPLGLFVVLGRGDEFWWARLFGLLGLVSFAIAVVRRVLFGFLTPMAILSLLGSIVCFMSTTKSEGALLMAITTIPFIYLSIQSLRQVARILKDPVRW